MANIAVHKADELAPATRAVVESELGRPLCGDEEVSIMAFLTHEAPSGEARQEAGRRLEEHFERIDQRTKDIPDREMDAVLDEALRNTRPGYRERR